MNRNALLLPSALLANAAFSGINGLALLLFPGWWPDWFDVLAAPAYAVLGAGLVGFAAILVWIIRDLDRRLPLVRWIVGADLAWVAATPVAMWLGVDAITPPGHATLAFVAAVVALLAALQWYGMALWPARLEARED